MTQTAAVSRARTSPLAAVLLTFIWPGLGHLALRDRRAAAIFAAPLLALAAWVALLVATRGIDGFAIMLVNPAVAQVAIWLVVATGIWRLVAVADAFRRAGGTAGRRVITAFGLVVVVAAIIAPHALGTWYAWSLYDAGLAIFSGDPVPVPAPGSSAFPGGSGDPGATGDPTTEPSFAPVSATRFTVLLTGIDSGPGRNHALTDTLVVVSVDRTTGKAAMVSFPRDLAYFPLYDGGTYAGRINSLRNWADANRTRYPDGGWATLARELGFLLGIPVPYYAAVDLAGFEQMIAAVGGVTVNNPKAIDDPSYGGWTDNRPVGFHLSAGVHELDGATALAFVRSRKGNGDNDFTRARRQQQLLVAIGRKLSDPSMFPRLPAILSAAKQTVRTNVPPDELQQLLDVANSVKNDAIRSVVLGPPYAEKVNVTSIYLLQFVPGMLEQISIDLFGSESRYATSSPAATPAPG